MAKYSVDDQPVIPGAKVLDVTAPQAVEIQISANGKVLWVNVDGILAFRACRIETLTVEDSRRKGGM